MTRPVSLLASVLLLAPLSARADRPVIDFSGARVQAFPLAIAPTQGPSELAAQIGEVLTSDLEKSGLFRLLDPASFLAAAEEPLEAPDFQRWQSVGAQGLLKASCAEQRGVASSGQLQIECRFHLFDAARGRGLVQGRASSARAGLRQVAHRIADEVVRAYTQEPSIFQTRLAYVRETEGGEKQIAVSDWDGAAATALTGASINLLPAWNPDGRRLAFTSFRNGEGAHLYTVDVATRQVRSLILTGDFATGAEYSPDGARVLFSSSVADNTDVWIARADGASPRRLTDARGIDISPSWSPDGKHVAFVSERAGSPQIFSMSAEGGGVRRLTFQGNYNQEPAWSPKADLIAFSGRDEKRVFDIYTVDVASGKIARLTQNAGTNEKPAWSPNGRYLMFSSTRSGRRQIWVMGADGSNPRQITHEPAGASDPAWGPLPR